VVDLSLVGKNVSVWPWQDVWLKCWIILRNFHVHWATIRDYPTPTHIIPKLPLHTIWCINPLSEEWKTDRKEFP